MSLRRVQNVTLAKFSNKQRFANFGGRGLNDVSDFEFISGIQAKTETCGRIEVNTDDIDRRMNVAKVCFEVVDRVWSPISSPCRPLWAPAQMLRGGSRYGKSRGNLVS